MVFSHAIVIGCPFVNAETGIFLYVLYIALHRLIIDVFDASTPFRNGTAREVTGAGLVA